MSDFINDNLRFWGTVFAGLAIHFVLSENPPLTRKQHIRRTSASIVCGVCAAFYGTDLMMEYFTIKNDYRDIVVLGLAGTGKQIMKSILEKAPEFGSAIVSAIKAKL